MHKQWVAVACNQSSPTRLICWYQHQFSSTQFATKL